MNLKEENETSENNVRNFLKVYHNQRYHIIYRGESDRKKRFNHIKSTGLMQVVSDEDLAGFTECLISMSNQGYHILDYISKELTFTVYIRNIFEIYKVMNKISQDKNKHF